MKIAYEQGLHELGDGLFAYLQPGRNHRTYLAIMRLFTSTLLADLSAGEGAAALGTDADSPAPSGGSWARGIMTT